MRKKFKTKTCIEISDPERFLYRVSKAIGKYLGKGTTKQMVYGEVRYYTHEDPPLGDWALPEKIALSKLKDFIWQREFRIAYPANNAFRVENVSVNIVPAGDRASRKLDAYPKKVYTLGDLSGICSVHKL